MTITRQGIIRGSRRGIITDGDIVKREFVETHILTSDDGTDDEGHVYAAMDADGYALNDPWTGEGGSTNSGVTVVNMVISDHDATKKRWEVEVQYSSELPDGGSNTTNGSEDPTDWDPKVRWNTSTEERPAYYDVTGDPVVLNNGEVPQYPPVMRRVPITTLTYSRWLSSYTSAINLLYAGTTNSDVFLGYPVNTAFMDGVSADSEFIFGFQYWWVTYNIRFDLTGVGQAFTPDGWKGRTFEVGTYFVDGGERKPATMFDKGPTCSLDAFGNFKPGEPDERVYDLYDQIPFTPII